jgi:hypothetical protein
MSNLDELNNRILAKENEAARLREGCLEGITPLTTQK